MPGGGGGGAPLGPSSSLAALDTQVHYGIAGFRADNGSVGFYRTSVHRKDPQNIILSHGVVSRVVDLRNQATIQSQQQHQTAKVRSPSDISVPFLGRYAQVGNVYSGSIQGDGYQPDLAGAAMTDGMSVETADELRAPGPPSRVTGGNASPPTQRGNNKPRWSLSTKSAQSSSPQQQLNGSGSVISAGAAAPISAPQSSPRIRTGPKSASIRASSHSPARPEALFVSTSRQTSVVGGPTAASPPRLVSPGSVSISNHCRGAAARQSCTPANRSASLSSTVHDCRDERCLHSRGDIMEVIAARSQVRAIESQLLHEEIRREQLASALSMEREKSQSLHATVHRLEGEVLSWRQNSDALENEVRNCRQYEEKVTSLAREAEMLRGELEKERQAKLNLTTVLAQHEDTITKLTGELRALAGEKQQLSREVSEWRMRSSQLSTEGNNGSKGAGLEEELQKLREEKVQGERLRRELLRALADKEKQISLGLAASQHSNPSPAASLSSGKEKPASSLIPVPTSTTTTTEAIRHVVHRLSTTASSSSPGPQDEGRTPDVVSQRLFE